MKRLVLLVTLLTIAGAVSFAQQTKTARKPRGMAIAVAAVDRLRDRGALASLSDFEYFFKNIQEIAKRDFPDIELRRLKPDELIRLHDGTGLNLRTVQPDLGFVLSAPGKKRRILSGIQTEVDFACAAAEYFGRPSKACPK